MCSECGCDEHGHAHDHDDHGHGHGHAHPHTRRITIEESLLAKNDRLAAAVRAQLAERQITAINLIGAPGSGKTTLLEHTIPRLAGDVAVGVLEGDQATDNDARRIAATGCQAFQITTGTGCHLDASMVERGLGALALETPALLFVENVGNLVCPALFDVGERAKVVVLSVTEGEDKPLKYPHVFRAASVMVLTKADLLPHLDVDIDAYIANARAINPALEVFPVAAMRERGHGLDEWCGWLRRQLGAGR